MYCPNCGKENSEQQKFCRSCGLSLQTISEALGAELSGGDEKVPVEPVRLDFKGWQNPLIYAISLLVLGLVLAITGKNIFGDPAVADIGGVIAVIGAILIGVKGMQLIAAQSKQLRGPGTSQKRVPASNPQPGMLAAEPPSITEHTTKHLDAVPEERSRDTHPV